MEKEENTSTEKTKKKRSIMELEILIFGVIIISAGILIAIFDFNISKEDEPIPYVALGGAIILYVIYKNYKYRKGKDEEETSFDEGTNINKQIPYWGTIIGIIITLWGILWVFFSDVGYFALVIVIMGIGITIYFIHEIYNYKKTGKVNVWVDERININISHSAKWGYFFLMISLAIINGLLAFGAIDNALFVTLVRAILLVGIGIFVIAVKIQ
ncbi:MAG: hypothetical protein CVT88_01000 [Candidatus Altiarchaeales archaeon HGW-Altiarchaeales-1]|nr:MAG: hypothetical protein CVT88_01000 [Candidatus Altiarchaeales archaeon HGW-Altiarchaeales-1]